jgi:hypothetical protein
VATHLQHARSSDSPCSACVASAPLRRPPPLPSLPSNARCDDESRRPDGFLQGCHDRRMPIKFSVGTTARDALNETNAMLPERTARVVKKPRKPTIRRNRVNGRHRHRYGVDLPDADRRALIAFLKTSRAFAPGRSQHGNEFLRAGCAFAVTAAQRRGRDPVLGMILATAGAVRAEAVAMYPTRISFVTEGLSKSGEAPLSEHSRLTRRSRTASFQPRECWSTREPMRSSCLAPPSRFTKDRLTTKVSLIQFRERRGGRPQR